MKVLRSKVISAAAVLIMAVGLWAANTTPASADSFSTGGFANSIWNWTTGTTTYRQLHAGDDLAFDVTSGIAIDMRWVSCDGTSFGPIRYNITPGESYRVLGAGFFANSCIHLQYRGYSSTGSFTGITYWNYNFA